MVAERRGCSPASTGVAGRWAGWPGWGRCFR